MKAFFIISLIIGILLISGCIEAEQDVNMEKYRNCTSACSVTIDSTDESTEFTSLYLCNEECKKHLEKS